MLLEAPAAVEAATSAALAEVVMRLDEDAFGSFFGRALSWAGADPDEASTDRRLSLSRALSFFRVFQGTQALLRSLFAPYFGLALPLAIAYFGVRQPTPVATAGSKRRRLEAASSEPDLEVAVTLSLATFLELGFRHEPDRPPTEQLCALEKALIARLGWPPAAMLFPALLGAVGALAGSLGVDGCKALHYELCMATQSDEEAQRRGAVRGLQRLYTTLPDAVLVLSPEAVPFLSELLEDADTETRACALELLNTLEQSNAGLLEED
jgi:U3 small nucleolar RNA-associated protein 10